MTDTYTVSTWDCEADDWQPEYTGLTKWQIRGALRELYALCWAPVNIQVKAETHFIPAARCLRDYDGFTTPKQRKELRAIHREACERNPWKESER